MSAIYAEIKTQFTISSKILRIDNVLEYTSFSDLHSRCSIVLKVLFIKPPVHIPLCNMESQNERIDIYWMFLMHEKC